MPSRERRWTLMAEQFIEWGARGREFESRRSDQLNQRVSSHEELARFDLRGILVGFWQFSGNLNGAWSRF